MKRAISQVPSPSGSRYCQRRESRRSVGKKSLMFELQESKIKTARAGTTHAAPRHGLESHQEITTIHALLLVPIKQVRWNLALHPKVINKPKLELECKERVKKKWILKQDILKEAKAVWFLQKESKGQHAISNYRVKKSY